MGSLSWITWSSRNESLNIFLCGWCAPSFGAAAGIRTRVPGSFHIVMGSRCHRPGCPSTLTVGASTLDHGRCHGSTGPLFLSVFFHIRLNGSRGSARFNYSQSDMLAESL